MGTCQYCAQFAGGWCNFHETDVAVTDSVCDSMRYYVESTTFGENMSYYGEDY